MLLYRNCLSRNQRIIEVYRTVLSKKDKRIDRKCLHFFSTCSFVDGYHIVSAITIPIGMCWTFIGSDLKI